jgi:hypothetical protein
LGTFEFAEERHMRRFLLCGERSTCRSAEVVRRCDEKTERKLWSSGFAQERVNDEPGHRVDQRGNDVHLAVGAAGEQILQLLASDHGRGYPSHRPAPSIVGPQHPT